MKNKKLKIIISVLLMAGLLFLACESNDQPILGVDEPDPNPTGKSPAIMDELLPSEGFLRDVVTIKGTGFDTSPENNLVKFGQKVGTVVNATSTELSVVAPNISGETVMVSVSVKGSEYWSNEMSFVFYDALSVIDEEVVWPNGVEVDDAGNIFIGSAADGIIFKITPAGDKSEFAAVPVSGGMKFGPGGYLYICAQGEGKIIRVSADGSTVEDYVEVESPVGFDWDANGDMFIVSNWIDAEEAGGIMKYSGGSLTLQAVIPSPKNCRVFGNYLYVNDIWEGRIIRFEIAGGSLGEEELVLEADSPSCLEFDADGRMYYTHAWEINLYTLEPDGTPGEILYEGQLMTPMRYMIFRNKKLYIIYPGWGDVGMTMSAYIGVESAPYYGRQ